MLINETDHRVNGRSSSAWAKYAEALRRISLAWRNSRFSRSSALRRSASSVGTPARLPLFTSAFFTHSSSVCPEQPRSEEHTSELQSLMRISYAVFCLKKKTQLIHETTCNIDMNKSM